MNNNNPLQVPLETVKKPKVVKRSSTAFSISPYFQNYDPTKPVEPTTVEKLLSEAGSFGIYQIFVFLLLGFSAVIPSMISFSYTLAAGIPPHRCKLYENETYIAINPQHQLLIEIFIPEYNQLTKQDYQCTFNRKIPKETIKYLTKNLTSHTIEEIIKSIDNETLKESEFIKSQSYITPIATKYKRSSLRQRSFDSSQLLSHGVDDSEDVQKPHEKVFCSSWVYDYEKYGVTLSTELNLVCSKVHIRALTQTCYSGGTTCSIITGLMSDKWGRRKTIYILILLLVFILNTQQILMHSTLPDYHKIIIFCVCRFIQGFSQTFYSVTVVLLSEITGPKRRVLAVNTISYFFALGQLLVAGITYYFKDWKLTYWALTVYVLPFVTYYYLIPESPRWLLQQNQLRKCRKILQRIFYVNRRPIRNRSEIFYNNLPMEAMKAKQSKQNPGYIRVLKRLIKSKKMRKRCCLLIYIWTVAICVYLGVTGDIPGLTDKPHILFAIGAACEIVGLIFCHLLSNRFGRRRLLIFFFIVTGAAVGLIPITYIQQKQLGIVFALLSKLAISCSQLLIYVYTTETYPTALRSTGVGLSASCARLGSLWIPQVSSTQQSIWFPLPYIVYSLTSFIAALCATQLPESNSNRKLPETIKEIEKQHKQISTNVETSPLPHLYNRRPSSLLVRQLSVPSTVQFNYSTPTQVNRRYTTGRLVNYFQRKRISKTEDNKNKSNEPPAVPVVGVSQTRRTSLGTTLNTLQPPTANRESFFGALATIRDINEEDDDDEQESTPPTPTKVVYTLGSGELEETTTEDTSNSESEDTDKDSKLSKMLSSRSSSILSKIGSFGQLLKRRNSSMSGIFFNAEPAQPSPKVSDHEQEHEEVEEKVIVSEQ